MRTFTSYHTLDVIRLIMPIDAFRRRSTHTHCARRLPRKMTRSLRALFAFLAISFTSSLWADWWYYYIASLSRGGTYLHHAAQWIIRKRWLPEHDGDIGPIFSHSLLWLSFGNIWISFFIFRRFLFRGLLKMPVVEFPLSYGIVTASNAFISNVLLLSFSSKWESSPFYH